MRANRARSADSRENDDLSSQELFREVNERAPVAGDGAHLHAFCECVAGCLEHVLVPVEGYESVRRFPTRFLMKAEHVSRAVERVVERHESYVVVEKIGPAATSAVRLDPRRHLLRPAASGSVELLLVAEPVP